MYAVEFQAKIKDGIIEIPEIYRNRFKERVRSLNMRGTQLQSVKRSR